MRSMERGTLCLVMTGYSFPSDLDSCYGLRREQTMMSIGNNFLFVKCLGYARHYCHLVLRSLIILTPKTSYCLQFCSPFLIWFALTDCQCYTVIEIVSSPACQLTRYCRVSSPQPLTPSTRSPRASSTTKSIQPKVRVIVLDLVPLLA